MRNETKIGLVVGLGFIVCFAIVLSHRGTALDGSLSREAKAIRDAPSAQNAEGVAAAEQRARAMSRRGTGRRPASEERPQETKTVADDPGVRQPIGSTAVLAETSSPPPGSAFERVDDARPSTSRVDLPSEQSVVESKETKAEESLGGPGRADMEVGTASSDSLASNAKPAPTAPAANRHSVRRGETLWQIARAHYGSASAATVEAIYQANRNILKAPHELKEGLELVLPDLTVARLAAEKASPQQPAVGKSASEKAPAEPKKQDKRWKWYEVSNGDRYTTIAQKELGDSREWKQLFELNRDIFPDPARLRPGVRIRIPVSSKASGRQG